MVIRSWLNATQRLTDVKLVGALIYLMHVAAIQNRIGIHIHRADGFESSFRLLCAHSKRRAFQLNDRLWNTVRTKIKSNKWKLNSHTIKGESYIYDEWKRAKCAMSKITSHQIPYVLIMKWAKRKKKPKRMCAFKPTSLSSCSRPFNAKAMAHHDQNACSPYDSH